MPAKSRGHGGGPDDVTPSRPHTGSAGRSHPASVREEGEILTEVVRTGRSTENGGTGPSSPPHHPRPDDLLTQGSGRSGETPRGQLTEIDPGEDADVRRSLEMENAGAVKLAERGYQVQQNPTRPEIAQARLDAGDVGDPGKDPDYLLEGRVFDCYSPVKPGKGVRGIWSEAEEKVEDGQTQRVVVNLEDWRGDISALKKQFADWPIPGLKEVKVITQDGDVVQIDLPPYRPMEVYPWLSNID